MCCQEIQFPDSTSFASFCFSEANLFLLLLYGHCVGVNRKIRALQGYGFVEFSLPSAAMACKRAMDDIERNMRPDPKKASHKPAPKRPERKDEVSYLHYYIVWISKSEWLHTCIA